MSQDPTTIIVAVSVSTPIPDGTNTPVEPTEAFKTTVFHITEDHLFLIAPIFYEPETVLFQLEESNQDLINTVAIYKADVPHPKKTFY